MKWASRSNGSSFSLPFRSNSTVLHVAPEPLTNEEPIVERRLRHKPSLGSALQRLRVAPPLAEGLGIELLLQEQDGVDHGGWVEPLASDVVTTATVDPMDSLAIMSLCDSYTAPNHKD